MKKIISAIITVLSILFMNWAFCPAWTIKSVGAWFVVIIAAIIFGAGCFIFDMIDDDDSSIFGTISGIIAGGLFILLALIAIFSSRLVNAGTYQRQMTVTNADFAEDMVEEDISSLALMDSESAAIYAKRVLGDLSPEEISVYTNSSTWSTISYQGKPMKVSSLEYAGLVKALQNSGKGIPAFVMVDPVNNSAQLVRVDKAMMYTPDNIFGYQLRRHIHSQYPSYIQGETFLELDEEGQPYYITQHIVPEIGLFGCNTVEGVFITNPCTGEIQYYKVSEVPSWVDIVFDGNYISKKYDDYGEFKQGYWNSIFGQQGCTVVTDDFGYKVIGEDVYIYTGVTSKASDESNVGFILVNGRTMETKYYSVVGAEEYSAMGAAEGEVQQYGYKGSFPSLINVEGQPTYVLVLKDANGLVKKIAMVNVEHYDVVAVEDNLNKVRSSYLTLLAKRGVTDKVVSDDLCTVKTQIERIEFVSVDGITTVYVKTTDGVFRAAFDESYILLNEGDNVSISYYKSGQPINDIDSIK